jgi:hypothetical protein
MCEIDPGTHKYMHSVLLLKTGCDSSGIRPMLTIGRKPRVEWSLLRTYNLSNYFSKSFSFTLVYLLLVLFKLLSFFVLFPKL